MTAPDLPTDDDLEATYQDALRAVRLRMGALNDELAADLSTALRDWASSLEAGVANLPDSQRGATVASITLTRETAQQLDEAVQSAAADARDLAYEDIQTIWEDAMAKLVGDAPDAERLLGAVRVPSLTMLNQFASLNAAAHWQTLLRGDILNAAEEANQIIMQGIAAGIDPSELASRLRRYVEGADTFAALFHDVETPEGTLEKIDLRQVPGVLRNAARQVAFNARRIAFSELQNARAEAEVQHFYHDALVAAVRWTLAPDRGTQILPDECDLLVQVDWYGLGPGVYPVDQVPVLPHPFCLPGQASVVSAETSAVMERWYEGDLVVLQTTAGKQLACTPNHPVLTAAGWVAAGRLHIGDYVLGEAGIERRVAADEDNEHMPARIEQVAQAFRGAASVTSGPVPVAAEDFHGDGRKSQVAIVRTNRLLVQRLHPALLQQTPDFPVQGRDVALARLNRRRPFHFLAHTDMTTSRRSVCSSHLCTALVDSHGRPLQAFGFRLRPQLHAHARESRPHDIATDAKAFREFVHRHARAVAPDQIVQIERRILHGTVYNLQTASGAYFADGIITHNCRCERLPVPRNWSEREDPKPEGELDPEAWKEVSHLGRTMTAGAWATTVDDALGALQLGDALGPG